jgi:hypothetical protein
VTIAKQQHSKHASMAMNQHATTEELMEALSTLPQDILHPSHHLLNVLLQIANKLGLSKGQC